MHITAALFAGVQPVKHGARAVASAPRKIDTLWQGAEALNDDAFRAVVSREAVWEKKYLPR